MKSKHLLNLLVIIICILISPIISYGENIREFNIGVLSFDNKNQTHNKWTSLKNYLDDFLDDYNFNIVPLFYGEMEVAIENKEIDFVFTNPGHFIELKNKYGLSGAIATLIEKDDSGLVYEFGGVIFTKADKEYINKIEDLKGKKISAVSNSSLGGYQASAYELYKHKIDLGRDVEFVFTGMPHSNSVLNVIEGRADAGFVRTGVLEAMIKEGILKEDDIKILGRKNNESFDYFLSTDLFPEWPFASLGHVPIDVSKNVAAALLQLKEDSIYAIEMDIYGFNVPSNYLPVENLMRSLRLAPFNEPVSLSFKDIWDAYNTYIITFILMAIFLLVIFIIKSISSKEINKINTDLKNAKEEMKKEKELLKTTLYSIGDGVIATDSQGNIEMMNCIAENISGWKIEDAKGLSFEKVFSIVNGFTGRICECPVKKVLKTGEIVELEDDTILIGRDGRRVPIEDSAAPILDSRSNIKGVVVVFRDCTDKEERQENIKYLSYHDQLTGLYNRFFLEEEIRRLDVFRNLPLTIMVLDVNGLKLVNDSFGHEKGDQLLKEVANILKEQCRKDDIIGRTGGDEFLILLPNTNMESSEYIMNRIYKALENKVIDNFIVSVSIGYAIKENIDESINDILYLAEDNMYSRKIEESQKMRMDTVNFISNALKDINEWEKVHSDNVARISMKIAKALNFKNDELEDLKIAALLHDIGKININRGILNKNEKLTEKEYKEIKKHPEISYQILKSIDKYTKISYVVLCHHERWDGKGYPKGLKEDEIPLMARIISIADTYESMTSGRYYKEAKSQREALDEIKRNSGSQFDPKIVELLNREHLI